MTAEVDDAGAPARKVVGGEGEAETISTPSSGGRPAESPAPDDLDEDSETSDIEEEVACSEPSEDGACAAPVAAAPAETAKEEEEEEASDIEEEVSCSAPSEDGAGEEEAASAPAPQGTTEEDAAPEAAPREFAEEVPEEELSAEVADEEPAGSSDGAGSVQEEEDDGGQEVEEEEEEEDAEFEERLRTLEKGASGATPAHADESGSVKEEEVKEEGEEEDEDEETYDDDFEGGNTAALALDPKPADLDAAAGASAEPPAPSPELVTDEGRAVVDALREAQAALAALRQPPADGSPEEHPASTSVDSGARLEERQPSKASMGPRPEERLAMLKRALEEDHDLPKLVMAPLAAVPHGGWDPAPGAQPKRGPGGVGARAGSRPPQLPTSGPASARSGQASAPRREAQPGSLSAPPRPAPARSVPPAGRPKPSAAPRGSSASARSGSRWQRQVSSPTGSVDGDGALSEAGSQGAYGGPTDSVASLLQDASGAAPGGAGSRVQELHARFGEHAAKARVERAKGQEKERWRRERAEEAAKAAEKAEKQARADALRKQAARRVASEKAAERERFRRGHELREAEADRRAAQRQEGIKNAKGAARRAQSEQAKRQHQAAEVLADLHLLQDERRALAEARGSELQERCKAADWSHCRSKATSQKRHPYAKPSNPSPRAKGGGEAQDCHLPRLPLTPRANTKGPAAGDAGRVRSYQTALVLERLEQSASKAGAAEQVSLPRLAA